MKKKALTLAAVAAIGAITFGSNGTLTASATASLAAPPAALMLSTTGFDCDTFCDTGGCSGGDHAAVGTDVPEEANSNKNDGWHLGCRSGFCEYSHGPMCGCFGECLTYGGAEFEEFRTLLVMGNVDGVNELLALYEDQVIINRERSAVQVLDCTGNIWAHLPVSQQFIRLLAGTGIHPAVPIGA